MSPWQNGFVESFTDRLRNEPLNREWFRSRAEAKVLIGCWRRSTTNIGRNAPPLPGK